MADMQPIILYERGKIANPGPLGMAATGVANWAVATHFIGWNVADSSIGVSVFYGGLAQFMAGIWCFRRNDTLGAFAFCTYGAWWVGNVGFGLLFAYSGKSQFYGAFDDPGRDLPICFAWYTLCILIVNTYMLITSLQGNPVGVINFFLLELSELLLVIGQFSRQPTGTGCILAGGAVQVALAFFCFYSAFAQMWNEMAGKDMIPLGPNLLDFSKKPEKKET